MSDSKIIEPARSSLNYLAKRYKELAAQVRKYEPTVGTIPPALCADEIEKYAEEILKITGSNGAEARRTVPDLSVAGAG